MIIYGKNTHRELMKNKKEEQKKFRTGIDLFLRRWCIKLWHRHKCLTQFVPFSQE